MFKHKKRQTTIIKKKNLPTKQPFAVTRSLLEISLGLPTLADHPQQPQLSKPAMCLRHLANGLCYYGKRHRILVSFLAPKKKPMGAKRDLATDTYHPQWLETCLPGYLQLSGSWLGWMSTSHSMVESCWQLVGNWFGKDQEPVPTAIMFYTQRLTPQSLDLVTAPATGAQGPQALSATTSSRRPLLRRCPSMLGLVDDASMQPLVSHMDDYNMAVLVLALAPKRGNIDNKGSSI